MRRREVRNRVEFLFWDRVTFFSFRSLRHGATATRSHTLRLVGDSPQWTRTNGRKSLKSMHTGRGVAKKLAASTKLLDEQEIERGEERKEKN
jgi:hypothetical protein